MIHVDNNDDLCYVFYQTYTRTWSTLTVQQIKESSDHQIAILLTFKNVLGDKTDILDDFTLFFCVRKSSLSGQATDHQISSCQTGSPW